MSGLKSTAPAALAILFVVLCAAGAKNDDDLRKAEDRLYRLGVHVSEELSGPLGRGEFIGRYVEIEPSDQVVDRDLADLPALNPISRLTVVHCAITEAGLRVLKDVDGLRHVCLFCPGKAPSVRPGVIDRVVADLADENGLESVSLSGPLRGETLGRFDKHERLTSLSLADVVTLTEEGLRQLGTLAQLQSLQLRNCNVDDSELARLAGLLQLKMLDLEANPVTGSGLQSLETLAKLETLSLARCFLRDRETAPLSGLKSLRVLRLSNNQVGDRTLQRLAEGGPQHLRELYLERTDVTDDGLAHLESFPDLEVVYLSATRVTGGGMQHLSGLEHLRAVDLRMSGLTDENVQGLACLQQVRSLNVDGNAISDAAVVVLARLRRLRNLTISGTTITDGGIERLKRALPECRIDTSSNALNLLHSKFFTGPESVTQ